MRGSQSGTCALLSRSMVRASQSGQQVSSSRVMRAKASMDPLSYRDTWGTNLFSFQAGDKSRCMKT